MLDDPFQSMDAEHCENLISAVIPRLVDGAGKQVIILTHFPRLAERIAALNSHRRTLRCRLEWSSGKWPSVRLVS